MKQPSENWSQTGINLLETDLEYESTQWNMNMNQLSANWSQTGINPVETEAKCER